MNAEKRTRYPGLASFTTAQKDLFFGRKQETRDLFHLISVERTVVLFSKSGYGKTSLLQAGVMPLLYGQWLVPVLVRFGTDALTPEAHFSIQLDTAWHRFNGKTESEAQKAARDTSRTETFWAQIAERGFGEAPAQFTPLFIFDQFEELFTLYPDPDKRKAFIEQLADLIHERMPERLRERVSRDLDAGKIGPEQAARLEKAPPMRFVFSIRSDMLHFMDELSVAIPYILRSRYQLFGLNEEQAKEAVLAPAALKGEGFASQPFSYRPEALDEIIGSLSKNREVESFQLQAVCQAIEEKIMRGQRQKFDPMHLLPVSRDGLRAIGSDFYGGREGIDDIIEENYNKRLDSLGDIDEAWPDLARRILEDVLVNKNDRRQSVDMASLDAPEALLAELERQRLVRKEPRLDSFYFEISHDTWLPAIVKNRKIRQEAEEKERLERQAEEDRKAKEKAEDAQRRTLGIAAGAVCLMLWSFYQSYRVGIEKRKAIEQTTLAKAAQEEAERLTAVSDSLLKVAIQQKEEVERQKGEVIKQKTETEKQRSEAEKRQKETAAALEAQKREEAEKNKLKFDEVFKRGETLKKAKKWELAKAQFEEALRIAPNAEKAKQAREQIQNCINQQ